MRIIQLNYIVHDVTIVLRCYKGKGYVFFLSVRIFTTIKISDQLDSKGLKVTGLAQNLCVVLDMNLIFHDNIKHFAKSA